MKRTPQGFTLIETLIAACILAIGSVAIASLFISSIRVNLANRERANASILAAEKMEELRLAASPADGMDEVSMPGSSFKYKRAWRVAGTEFRTITLVVSAHEQELVRVVTEVGPLW